MSDRKTSKAVLVSSDEEDFVPLKRKMKSSGEVSKKGKRNLKVDLNLGEAAVPRVALPPYSIYLGSDILLEVKPFKKILPGVFEERRRRSKKSLQREHQDDTHSEASHRCCNEHLEANNLKCK
ncbi:hypothetical protein JTE90_004704 [Oedothorax gibbosus]|uniref:Uncharacterized protein n=1 Tax=Oedothorax gibbosus TaxID=931172 RepID=A0AAV6TNC0_9ARAC|nr:hypothetical protein JTE90_004704 [Oedothorax gibbosus]